MLGVSFFELLIALIVAVLILKPADLIKISKQLVRYYYKLKNFISQFNKEFEDVKEDLGIEKIKEEVEKEARKITKIIDLEGNEHIIEDIDNLRGDLSDDELKKEVLKYNKINQD